MNYWQQVKESREDGCMEALNYYADTFLDKGKALNVMQTKDYKEKCAILQCMGEDASRYADMMLNLLNE